MEGPALEALMTKTRKTDPAQRGATLILFALGMVAVLGAAALAIDLGYGLVVKSELQNTADAGTLAANRELSLIYQGLSSTCATGSADCYWATHVLTASERSRIETKVNSYTQQNKAGGKPIVVSSSDMVYGKYSTATNSIVPTSPAYTGVMGISVTARRDGSGNGPVSTMLGKVLGFQSLSVQAKSGAALSPLGKVPAGGLGIPVGISKFWFTARNTPCGKKGDTANHGIRLYPTGPQNGETLTNAQGCAGWHTFTDYPASAAKLGNVLDGLRTGTYSSPVTQAGSTMYNFTGGVVSSQFSQMKALYDARKASDGTWTAIVPVYDAVDCSNPNGAIKIIGFATAWIYSVRDVKEGKFIDATVSCNIVDIGEAGGPDYGTLVGRPGMVQ